MTSEPGPPPGRWRRRAIAAAGVLAAYAAVGFLAVPAVLHRQLERRLTAALHREVAVQRVRANPFSLSVTIDGLVVRDRDGKGSFLSWDRLHLAARLWPLAAGEVRLATVALAGLRVNVTMGPDGRLDVDDLVEASPADAPGPGRPSTPTRLVFGVDRLSVERAELAFVDRSRGRPFRTTVGPVTFRLDRFRTRPDARSPYAFSGTTESGERFSWAGTLLVKPLRSRGEIAVDDLRLPKYAPYYERQVGFDLRDGLLSARARYDVEWGPTRREARLSDGSLALRSVALALRGRAAPCLELPRVDVSGIAADLLGRSAEVGKLAVEGGVVRARRDAEGRVDLADLPGGAAERTGPPPRAAGPPYRWSVGEIAIAGFRAEVEDGVPRRPVKLAVAPLDLSLRRLSSAGDDPTELKLSARLGGAGRIEVEGSAQLRRRSAQVAVRASGLDLAALDPYLETYGGLAARLGGGTLGLDARLRADLGAAPARWSLEGDAGLSALALLDLERGEELVGWRELQVSGIRVAAQPAGAAVQAVRWVEPRLRVQVSEDRSTNLRRVLGPPAGGVAGGDATASRRPPPAPYPVRIGSLRIVRGRAGFVDRSVKPPASLAATALDVRARELSNALTARSQVTVRGLVGGAPLEVNGTLSPRLVNDATSLAMKAKGIDLLPLGPYFARHAGYGLEKGKLDLDLAYRVARRQLEGRNVARVDQLTLGDASGSPDATRLPVKLALAVLRDRDGVIDVDVPVRGSVDDPDFSLGGLVWHAVVNVLTKAATAPFSLLGKLFGAGDQRLDVVEFRPGTAELTAAGQDALRTLTRALDARPSLRLDVEGTADDAADGRALRERDLRRRAREAKWRSAPARRAARTPEEVVLLDDEYLAWVETAYRAALAAERSTSSQRSAQPVPAAARPDRGEMEAHLLATATLAADALPALAQQRAEAVRERLAGGTPPLAPDRVFLVRGGERAAREGGARAYLTLE